MPDPLRVFIGYDAREPIAYHVLTHSILRRASRPVAITPLVLDHLRGLYARERDPWQSTAFTYTRFLVPYLSGYQGHSLYLDCDMLCRADLAELWGRVDLGTARRCPDEAVWVCQHDYEPKTATKMDGQVQTAYPRKNWSSLMLFNNERCRQLSPGYIGAASGMDLHRFAWTMNERIGSLSVDWNWLVGEYPPNPEAKILHYTLGGPWFPECPTSDHAKDWLAERDAMIGDAR